MKTFFEKIWRVGRWILLSLGVLFICLIIYRIPAVNEQDRTKETIAYIQAQRLTMEDVTGERLPPIPDQVLNDSTIEGIDVNKNGIRDDVERSIFDKYPGDKNIKIRAAMLQYAMGLQLGLTQVFNSETWAVATQQSGRGFGCIYENINNNDVNLVLMKTGEVEGLIKNTNLRKKWYDNLDKFRTSFSTSNEKSCDLDIGEF